MNEESEELFDLDDQKQSEAPKKKINFTLPDGKTLLIGVLIFLLGLSFTIVYFKRTYNAVIDDPTLDGFTNSTQSLTGSLIAFQPDSLNNGMTGLSQTEYNHLLYMREEEKLAEDVYQFLYQQWNLNIFNSIAQSEQRHTTVMANLLQKYNIPDPALNKAAGTYQNQHIANLYQQLTTKGQVSVLEALKVGALIEEVDINDLNTAIAQTGKTDIINAYTRIQNGSYHHLRSFVHGIELYGQKYQAQVLSQDMVNQIITSALINIQ